MDISVRGGPPPTQKQKDFAEDLIKQLYEESFRVDAKRFENRVRECKGMLEMSRHIDDMLKLLRR